MNQSLLIWGAVLIFGFPILTIVLGQLGDSLKRREHPFATFVRNLQYFVLPPLILLLIFEQILGWKELVVFLQVLETVLWIAIIYTTLSLLRVVLTLDEKYYPWQIPVANLFFQVIRAAVILVLVGYALAEVWKVDISKAAQAFGIGSLVIALALQDTLSNLVSGFLLLADSPFKKGDWLQLGDINGQVIDMNWRSVRLKTVEGNVVIIPNGALGKERILNYSLPDAAQGVWIEVSFSNDDPPNRVKQLLQQVLLETQGTDLEKGFRIISTGSFDDFSISYKVMFMAKDFMSTYQARSDFKTRLYYSAQRRGLSLSPYPTNHIYHASINEPKLEQTHEEITEYFQSLPYFTSLSIKVLDRLALDSTIEYYGKEEQIIQEGEFVGGLYIIQNGHAKLTIKDINGIPQEVARIANGDFFGESVFMSDKPSALSISALDDLKVIRIEADTAANLLVDNRKFAKQIDDCLDERRSVIQRVRGTGEEVNNLTDNDNSGGYSILKQFKKTL